MGYIAHLLTAILVVLKLVGVIAISWWLVFLPSIIVIALAFIILLLAIAGVVAMS